MPPTILPKHLRELDVLVGSTRNQQNQLLSRQGLEGGMPGPPGPPGEKGAAGSTFVFTQGAPAEVWTIKHELKLFPSVTVQDTAGDEVSGITVYISENELTVTFSSPFSGVAYLN
jgi:hypothetical protein